MVWLDAPEGFIEKSKPMPDKGTNSPVGSALLVTIRLPLCGPGVVGTNSTVAVQLAPGASVEEQVVVTIRKPAVTASAKPPRLFTLSGLVKVTVMGALIR